MFKFFKSSFFTKRKFKRINSSLNAKFKIISGKNPKNTSSIINSIAKNISLNGLCLETSLVQSDGLHISHDSSMMTKNKLDIEIELPNKNDKGENLDVIHILGRVTWYDKKTNYQHFPFEVGIDILEISDEDFLKLKTFI